jgi:hypothetical protein
MPNALGDANRAVIDPDYNGTSGRKVLGQVGDVGGLVVGSMCLLGSQSVST